MYYLIRSVVIKPEDILPGSININFELYDSTHGRGESQQSPSGIFNLTPDADSFFARSGCKKTSDSFDISAEWNEAKLKTNIIISEYSANFKRSKANFIFNLFRGKPFTNKNHKLIKNNSNDAPRYRISGAEKNQKTNAKIGGAIIINALINLFLLNGYLKK